MNLIAQTVILWQKSGLGWLLELALTIVATGIVSALIARAVFQPGKRALAAWAGLWLGSSLGVILYFDSLAGGSGFRALMENLNPPVAIVAPADSVPLMTPAPQAVPRRPTAAEQNAEIARKYAPR